MLSTLPLMARSTAKDPRSHCPINFGVELFGDKWSLLIVRDIVFFGKNTYGDFLKSDEGIATNILASRLAFLEEQGIVRKAPHSTDNRKDHYSLTEKGLDLIPILLDIVLWSAKYDAKSRARKRKDFVARIKKGSHKVGAEIQELVRDGGCLFPAPHR
jgi:DNA-binding HxlR family transcriptional regulator